MDHIKPDNVLEQAFEYLNTNKVKLINVLKKDIPTEKVSCDLADKYGYMVISFKPNDSCLLLLTDLKTGQTKRINLNILDAFEDE